MGVSVLEERWQINVLKGFQSGKGSFILDDFIVASSIFHETRNGGWGLDKKGNFPLQNPPIYSLKKPWHELLTPSFLTHMSFFLGSKKEWFWLNPLPPFCSMSLFLPFFFLEVVPKELQWQLLLSQSEQNFKCKFVEPFWTGNNCHKSHLSNGLVFI